MILSKIEWLKDNRRVDIFADGEFLLRLHADVLAAFGLRTGDTLSSETVESLKSSAEFALAKEKALQILARRYRSEKELRTSLRNKQFHPQTINRVVAHLYEKGFLDDKKFAQVYTNHILLRKPAAKAYLQRELKLKGINSGTIKEVLDETLQSNREEENALIAARSILKRIQSSSKKTDPKKINKRLTGALSRRGFSFAIIHKILQRLDEPAPEDVSMEIGE